MLTKDILQKEIDALIAANPPSHKYKEEYKKDYARAEKRVRFLRECLMYLETNPKEEFIQKQLASLNKKLERIVNGFQDWKSQQQTTKQKQPLEWLREYNSFMGKSHIENQIKNIEFILS